MYFECSRSKKKGKNARASPLDRNLRGCCVPSCQMTSRRIPVDVSWTPSSSSSLMPQQTVWNTMENDRPTLIKTTVTRGDGEI